jgi:hypothetical protein
VLHSRLGTVEQGKVAASKGMKALISRVCDIGWFDRDSRAVAVHYTALWPPLPHESGVVSYAVARPCATFDSPWSDTGLRKCSGLISHELCVRIRTFGARSTRTAQSKESLSPLGTYSATRYPRRPLSYREGSRVRRTRRQAAYVMITHSIVLTRHVVGRH